MLSFNFRWLAYVVALLPALILTTPGHSQDGAWRIAKVSGEVWIGGSGAQPASMSGNPVLSAGETVRTGRNGRVLLVRGAESILVSANSSISLPEAGRTGQTTIIQQAGSILLDVEKRNVQHFEVETPYLAAVVKGTQFRVSLQNGRAKVDVVRGQVQVSDFRSGQFALVSPGQSARASFGSNVGLQLSGSGSLAPVQTGPAQAPRVAPLAVPSRGFGASPGANRLQSSGETPRSAQAAPAIRGIGVDRTIAPGVVSGPKGAIRNSAPIGDVKLDISKVTRGMARSEAPANQGARRATVWSTGELNPGTSSAPSAVVNRGSTTGTAETNSGSAISANVELRGSSSAVSSNAGTRGTATAQGNSGNANGNNGNGNANGNNGNGNANGNNGNGNANGNNGNGNANGNNGSGNANGNNGSGNANGNNGNGDANGNNGNGNANGNNGNANGNSGNGNANGNGKK